MADIANTLTSGLQQTAEAYAKSIFGCCILRVRNNRSTTVFANKLQWIAAMIRTTAQKGNAAELIDAYVLLNLLSQCKPNDKQIYELAAMMQNAWLAVFLVPS